MLSNVKLFTLTSMLIACAVLVTACGTATHPLPADATHSSLERQARSEGAPARISFTDGSELNLAHVSRIERRPSKHGGSGFIIVHAKDILAGYHADMVSTISQSDRSTMTFRNPDDPGNPGGGGGGGGCDASVSACPACDLCSGTIPDLRGSDVDCIMTCPSDPDPFGNYYGTYRFRFLHPNITCSFDFGSGDSDCDFEASNSGGGSDSNNHLISYTYFPFSQSYTMRCSGFSQAGLASGTFSDHRGAIFMFPVAFQSNTKTSFSIGSSDASNTAMYQSFFGIPKFYQGFCAGAN